MDFIALQVWAFLGAVVLGCIFCAIYDLIRAFATQAHLGTTATAVLDILFAGSLGMVSFVYMLAKVGGKMRLFVLLGGAIGAVLFALLISPFFRPLLETVFKILFSLTLRPILFIVGYLQKFALKAINVIKKMYLSFNDKKRGKNREQEDELK